MRRRDPAKEQYWRRLLRQWRRSGLSGRAFCSAEGVSEPSFYAWRCEIARRDRQTAAAANRVVAAQRSLDEAAPAFLKLAVDVSTAVTPAIEVVVAERRVLRVRPGFDADLLRQLVRLLEEPSC